MMYRIDLRDRVAVVALDRPERKNPLNFDRHAALRNGFWGGVMTRLRAPSC